MWPYQCQLRSTSQHVTIYVFFFSLMIYPLMPTNLTFHILRNLICMTKRSVILRSVARPVGEQCILIFTNCLSPYKWLHNKQLPYGIGTSCTCSAKHYYYRKLFSNLHSDCQFSFPKQVYFSSKSNPVSNKKKNANFENYSHDYIVLLLSFFAKLEFQGTWQLSCNIYTNRVLMNTVL